MGKTLADVDLQVRQLIGDFQRTNFTQQQVTEAINFAQNAMMRLKGFKVASRLYDLSSYPTGLLPSNWLTIKRVQLVQTTAVSGYTIEVDPVAAQLVANVAFPLSVFINRFGGFGGSVSVFIPLPFASNDGFGIGVYINSPTAKTNGEYGYWINESSLGTFPDAGFVYGGAPHSFTVDVAAYGSIFPGLLYSDLRLTGFSSIPPVLSNPFSIIGGA